MSLRHACIVFVTIILFWPASARGAVTAWTDVTIRIYDTSGTIAVTNRSALDLAAQTLSSASVEVVWKLCATATQMGAASSASRSQRVRCDAPLAPGELALRIVRLPVPQNYRGALPLGDALIDAAAASGVLATIYLDRVLWMAQQSHTDSRALLGRAIAHELGHLLLATSAHGPVGLMRAMWSQEEVRRGRPKDWVFAPQEIAAMRRRLEARRQTVVWGTR